MDRCRRHHRDGGAVKLENLSLHFCNGTCHLWISCWIPPAPLPTPASCGSCRRRTLLAGSQPRPRRLGAGSSRPGSKRKSSNWRWCPEPTGCRKVPCSVSVRSPRSTRWNSGTWQACRSACRPARHGARPTSCPCLRPTRSPWAGPMAVIASTPTSQRRNPRLPGRGWWRRREPTARWPCGLRARRPWRATSSTRPRPT